MSGNSRCFRSLSILTLTVGLLAFAGALQAGPTTRPGMQPTTRPAGAPASQPEVYSAWPFSAEEGARRQEATAKALGQPKELTLDLGNKVGKPSAASQSALPDAEAVAELVAQLNHSDFKVREAATLKLIDMDELARPMLEAKLKQPGISPEVARRLETALKEILRTVKLNTQGPMKFKLIPAGKFMMGSPDSEQKEAAKSSAAALGWKEEEAKNWFAQESPQHEVTIRKAFYLGIHYVTQEQYQTVMGRNPSYFQGAKNPVEMVSWDDAVEFCKKLSGKTGKTVQLPTEAQWEYACRAGTKTPFYTGETIKTDQANFSGYFIYGKGVQGENRDRPTPVGIFKPNAFGLYDMHGNVEQWCADWYDAKYYGNSPKADPTGPGDGKERVLRGGSWCANAWDCRSASRTQADPGDRICGIGFRVVISAGGD